MSDDAELARKLEAEARAFVLAKHRAEELVTLKGLNAEHRVCRTIRRPTHGQRMYPAPDPRFHTVRPMLFIAPASKRPSTPCTRCGSRDGCRHRGQAV